VDPARKREKEGEERKAGSAVRPRPGSVDGPRGGKERGKERLPGWAARERRESWLGWAAKRKRKKKRKKEGGPVQLGKERKKEMLFKCI
jgi:hypothetical protein